MSNRHQTRLIDRARDELCSHVVRCQVLEAEPSARVDWLDDTMYYMAQRYPQLDDLELARLKSIGRRFIKPVIPHGARANATNRAAWETPEQTEEWEAALAS